MHYDKRFSRQMTYSTDFFRIFAANYILYRFFCIEQTKDIMQLKYLSDINWPSDLRKLPVEALPDVCNDLRADILEELAVNPGHLASSLGVVELTVALHYVFDTPYDRIVWDVGHQAYGHKILTGRRKEFYTNRKKGGIRPFPSPDESEYDTFTCGHASNSISAALGMAVAAHQKGEQKRRIVCVIGDGAMSGGLAFEGLNNASESPNDMLIILNDNNMSIDRSVGGMKHYLLHLHTSSTYNRMRFRAARTLTKWGLMDDQRRRSILRFNNALKSLLTKQRNIFEGMDIRYFGPTDGHDVVELVRVLREIKGMTGPKLLHIHTTKGKGYKPAEQAATIWHAPGKFNVESGERIAEKQGETCPPKFQDVFGETLVELAQQNERIVGITPAMPTGCSMNMLMEAMPNRAFDVGIAEGHAVTFAGGLAKEGMIPFCNIYSAFAQRSYDNIIHDVAMIRLPVVFCFDRAGLVGEDGPTHHGIFDMAALRPVPNLTIASPYDECELRRLMYTAQLPDKGPFVIRYPRGSGRLTEWKCPLEEVPVGKGRIISEGNLIAVLSIGPIGNIVQDALNLWREKAVPELQEQGIAHYDMRFLKPIDQEILQSVGERFKHVITIEDGVRNGGLGSAVLEYMNDHFDRPPHVYRMGIGDSFVPHGTVAEEREMVGIDAASILKLIEEILAKS